MIVKNIKEQIAETDIDGMRKSLGQMPYDPYPYQYATHRVTSEEVRKYTHPFIIKASVSAGKTILISMFAKRCMQLHETMTKGDITAPGFPCLILSRQAEIVSQDAKEMIDFGVPNSIFCAGLNKKSTYYPVIAGSEGTVVNALEKKLADFVPRALLIDECVTGDTLIGTKSGTMRIDDPALIKSSIMCIDDNGNHYYHKPKRVFSNGIKRASSIKLSSGEVITCTGNHKLLSQGSWRRADSLKIGESLTLSSQQDSFLSRLVRASAAVAEKLCQMFR